MMRGTTPINVFTLPFDVDVIEKVRIIYSQNRTPVVVKNTEDCTLIENRIEVKLTQEDTLAFNHKKVIEVQVHVLDVEGNALTSAIKAFRIGLCLDEEVI